MTADNDCLGSVYACAVLFSYLAGLEVSCLFYK